MAIRRVDEEPVTHVASIDEISNLVIEAISLLSQRQREIEAWATERIKRAEDRAAAAEQHYMELERRLGTIEQQLMQLGDLDAPRVESNRQERLTRLREQVEGLRASGPPETSVPTVVTAAVLSPPPTQVAASAPPRRMTAESMRVVPASSAGSSASSASPAAPISPPIPTPAAPPTPPPPPAAEQTPVVPPPAVAHHSAVDDMRHRVEGIPRDRVATVLVVVGVLVMLYAVVWQISVSLGLS